MLPALGVHNLSILEDITVGKSQLDKAAKWADLVFKLVGTVAAICGIVISFYVPIFTSREATKLQFALAQQNVALQQTIEAETSKREYVRMALDVLKENKGVDPRIRALAVQIFEDNPPVKSLDKALVEDLKSGNTSFSFLSPQLAATPKGRAAQLAGEMFTLAVERAITLPKYGDLPKHTQVPTEHTSKDYIYKQYTLKEFDADFAKDFHKRFDARIKSALDGLEQDTNQLSTKEARTICKTVGNINTGEACASKIFEYAIFRNPD